MPTRSVRKEQSPSPQTSRIGEAHLLSSSASMAKREVVEASDGAVALDHIATIAASCEPMATETMSAVVFLLQLRGLPRMYRFGYRVGHGVTSAACEADLAVVTAPAVVRAKVPGVAAATSRLLAQLPSAEADVRFVALAAYLRQSSDQRDVMARLEVTRGRDNRIGVTSEQALALVARVVPSTRPSAVSA